MRYFQSLGFNENFKKSQLIPQQQFTWLGLDWDLATHKVSIPPEIWKEIAKLVRKLIRSKYKTWRMQERVLGSLNFASLTDPVLKARLKDTGKVWQKKLHRISGIEMVAILLYWKNS